MFVLVSFLIRVFLWTQIVFDLIICCLLTCPLIHPSASMEVIIQSGTKLLKFSFSAEKKKITVVEVPNMLIGGLRMYKLEIVCITVWTKISGSPFFYQLLCGNRLRLWCKSF